MARKQELRVPIVGDTTGLNRAFRTSSREADRFGRNMEQTHRRSVRAFVGIRRGSGLVTSAFIGGGLGTLGGIGLVAAMKSFVDASARAEVSQSKLRAQLKASGISFRAHGKEIDNVIQKTSRLSGLDDEDLQDAFTNIIRVTGNVSKSLRLTGLAADFARAKHLDVAKAGEIVGKVAGGNIGILSRYGLALGKGATATEALGKLHQKFAGQAKAYGQTTAGAFDRLQVAGENLRESIGKTLAPTLAKGANALARFLDQMRTGQGAGGDFVRAMNAATGAFVSFVGAVRAAAKVVGPTVIRAMHGAAEAVSGLAQVVRGVSRVITGIFHGQWRKAWGGAQDIVRGALRNIVGLFKAFTSPFSAAAARLGRSAYNGIRDSIGRAPGAVKDALGAALGQVKRLPGAFVSAGKALARAIIRGVLSGLKSLPGALLGSLTGGVKGAVGKAGSALGSLNPFGDGFGVGSLGSISPGGLKGADADLAPFAALGARFGLHVSSGLRPGAITKSGNVSYHSSGDAIDEAGPPNRMLAFARYLRSAAGGRLAELIYTPMGVGIKDGRPFQYTGAVAADHLDHVHVAFTGGSGDGIGRQGDGLGRPQLANLWVRAGGDPKVARLMAEVAWAESHGNPSARNPSGATGLWQILGNPFRGNARDPLTNARMAVWKYQHQGLGAWAASKGVWGRYHGPKGISAHAKRSRRPVTIHGRAQGAATLPSFSLVPRTGSGGSIYDKIHEARAAVDLLQAEGAEDTDPRLRGTEQNLAVLLTTLARDQQRRAKIAARQGRKGRARNLLDAGRANYAEAAGLAHFFRPPPPAEADGTAAVDDKQQALIDAINAQTEAAKALKEGQDAIRAELAEANAHTKAINSVTAAETRRALGDLLSGQLGFKMAGRAITPSSGVGTRY